MCFYHLFLTELKKEMCHILQNAGEKGVGTLNQLCSNQTVIRKEKYYLQFNVDAKKWPAYLLHLPLIVACVSISPQLS